MAGAASLWVWSDMGQQVKAGKGWVHKLAYKWRSLATAVAVMSALSRAACWVQGHAELLGANSWLYGVLKGSTRSATLAALAVTVWFSYFLVAFFPHRLLHSEYAPPQLRVKQLILDINDLTDVDDGDAAEAVAEPDLISRSMRARWKDKTDVDAVHQVVRMANTRVTPLNAGTEDALQMTELMMRFWCSLEGNADYADPIFRRARAIKRDGWDPYMSEQWRQQMTDITIAAYGRRWQPDDIPGPEWTLLGMGPGAVTLAGADDEDNDLKVRMQKDKDLDVDLFSQAQRIKLQMINKDRARHRKPPLTLAELFEGRLEQLESQYLPKSQGRDSVDDEVDGEGGQAAALIGGLPIRQETSVQFDAETGELRFITKTAEAADALGDSSAAATASVNGAKSP
eukprot:TRINITY_DN1901_c0_g1_i2.p1 TRINITY_DN1901_c0_g1~~TRINITY_DN1901_c0_g1_i2.p1  ORF type:complete len:399 (+),score=75.17 TRINITY_DN1901_c0_g1_i2:741-1937(+)